MKQWVRWTMVWVLGVSLGARAQSNYNPFPVGERASGMGGAYTALSNDEAGSFYNPAGPAFTLGDSLAVSTSFYGVIFGRNADWLGAGEDFRYSTLNLIPTTASTLWHLGQPTRPDESSPFVLMFNVFSPASFNLDQRRDVRNGDTTLFVALSDRTIMGGPSAAYRFTSRFALGVAVWASFHTMTERFDLTDTFPSADPSVTHFLQVTLSREQTNFGLQGIVGARYAVTDHWFAGLSVRSGTVPLAGSGTRFSRLGRSLEGEAPSLLTDTAELQTQRILPTRVSLGVAYEKSRRLAFSADVMLYPPLEYFTAQSTARPDLNEAVSYGWMANAAVGAELWLTQIVPLRMGLFTDLSPAPMPTVLPGGSSEDHVDLIGATLSCGISTKSASTTFGIVAEYGWAKLVGIDLSQATYQLVPTTGTQWRIFFVWSSSYAY